MREVVYNSIMLVFISGLISGLVVALVNHFLTTRQRREKEKREQKLKSYSVFLDGARAFLDDPNYSKDERRKIKKRFLAKYYDEIILFADKDVQEKIESFINTGGVSATNPGDQVAKFREMIISIRKDLGFSSKISENFKMYSLDVGEERD